jgi:hypothetical protein
LEILIALGLFALTISALLMLFPVALRSDRENADETRSALIATGIMDAMNSGEGRGKLLIATGMSNGLPLWQSLIPERSTNISVLYDSSGDPLRIVNPSEIESPIHDTDGSSLVTISLLIKPSLPGIISCEASVGSPASAPQSGRTINRFVRQMAAPVVPTP